ncbi:MAG: fimbrillin family protein [Rikenellaceae bacterium]|jgi:hypothetical protein|nr:fimbrillin family protein [Rikenellaceae bacterium]
MKKKLFLGVAMCAMLFGAASCAKETGESLTTDGGTIQFRPALGKQTRASETTLDGLKAEVASGGTAHLDVYAYKAGDATQQGAAFELKWDSSESKWVVSNGDQEHPGFALRYYSAYPAVTGTPTTDDWTFSYTIEADPSDQVDLIGDAVPAQMNAHVNLNYDHLLSQVNFAVVAMPYVKITISNITVTGVTNQASYSFKNGVWTGHTGTGTYVYVPDGGAKTTLEAGSVASSSKVDLGNGTTLSNALMLMPQVFNTSSTATFSFTYSLDLDKDSNGSFETSIASGKSATVNFGDFDKLEWEKGFRYLYVIDFESWFTEGKITFDVQVSGWQDATNMAETVQVTNATVAAINAAVTLQSEAKLANNDLNVFPINVVAGIPSSKITIAPVLTNFEVGDVIRIECADATEAGYIELTSQTTTANHWVLTTSGRVAILTMTAGILAVL